MSQSILARPSLRSESKAFTLIEVLVCVAILAILAGILFVAMPGVIASQNATVSISHLRALQLANISWATDHNGQYVPACAADLTVPWPVNGEFAANYLGTPNPGFSSAGLPLLAKSGFPARPDPSEPGLDTIGYNSTDRIDGALPPDKFSFRTTDIRNASQMIAFAEAIDWQISYIARTSWVPADDSGTTKACAPAYRYNGKCIAVAYDGNTFMFTVNDSAEKSLWYVNP
jgi:prepilin-type N-terminal cleavage/methylation domain-containing protein